MSTSPFIPALRFPGFEGDWEEKKVNDLLQVIDGDRGANYPNTNDFSSIEYCLFLNAKNVTKNGFSFEENSFITKEKDNQLRKGKLKRNDIVLTTRGSVGHVAFFNKVVPFNDIRINSGMVLLRESRSVLTSNYIYLYLKSKKVQNKIQRISFGSAQPQLTVKEINNLKLTYPKIVEQQKIASFLEKVDGWIENLKQQKQELEKYKKGMIQKIFAQEIRFKDENGNDFPEWENKRLDAIGSVVGGGTPDTTKNNYWDGGINWFTPTEIKQKFVGTSVRKISVDGLKNSSARLLPIGTLLLTSRATVGDVSICKEECCTNQGFQSVIVNDKNSNIFLYFWITKNKNEFLKKANGSTFLEISGKEVKKIKVMAPHLPEQQKIAGFLTSIDKVIQSKQLQISQALEWKKGLMQGLFV